MSLLTHRIGNMSVAVMKLSGKSRFRIDIQV
jgi:hypothetical protein